LGIAYTILFFKKENNEFINFSVFIRDGRKKLTLLKDMLVKIYVIPLKNWKKSYRNEKKEKIQWR
jgi:hypothetical protein